MGNCANKSSVSRQASRQRTGDGGNKFHDGLMRKAKPFALETLPQKSGRPPLLIRVSMVESIHQNVGVNENGHENINPNGSTLGREGEQGHESPDHARVAEQSPDRTSEADRPSKTSLGGRGEARVG